MTAPYEGWNYERTAADYAANPRRHEAEEHWADAYEQSPASVVLAYRTLAFEALGRLRALPAGSRAFLPFLRVETYLGREGGWSDEPFRGTASELEALL